MKERDDFGDISANLIDKQQGVTGNQPLTATCFRVHPPSIWKFGNARNGCGNRCCDGSGAHWTFVSNIFENIGEVVGRINRPGNLERHGLQAGIIFAQQHTHVYIRSVAARQGEAAFDLSALSAAQV